MYNRPLHNQWTRQKRAFFLASTARVGAGGVVVPTPDFSWEPETADTLPSGTFTRATIGRVLTTTDGTTNWYGLAKAGEIRFEGLRRVENLVSNTFYEDLDTWTKASGGAGSNPVVSSSVESPPPGTSASVQQVVYDCGGTGGGDVSALFIDTGSAAANRNRVVSIWARSTSGTFDINLGAGGSGTLRKQISITTTWQRFASSGDNFTNANIALRASGDISGSSSFTILFAVDGDAGPQAEIIQTTKSEPNTVVDPGVAASSNNSDVASVRYFNTTNGNSVDGNGVVTEAAGTTITGGGFLSEPAVTNQFSDSALDGSSWMLVGLTATNNGINDLGLEQVTIDAGTSVLFHSAVALAGLGSQGSAYAIAKAGTGNFLIVSRGASSDDYACFNLSTGAVTEEGAGITSSFIEDLGNSWYKCGIVTTDTSTTAAIAISDTGTPGTNAPFFTGANETILVCHAQYETVDFPTSPIVTTGSTVTRNADRLELTAATVGSDAAPFSIFADQTTPDVLQAALGAGDSAIVGLNGTDRLAVATGAMGATGSGLGATVSSTFGPSLRHKIAARFDTNDVAVAIEDETTATDSSYTVATGNLDVAHAGSGREHRGKIHKFEVYDTALTNEQLELLA